MGSQTDTTEHHTPPPGKKATWSQSLATDSSCSLGGNIGFLLEEGSLDGKKKKLLQTRKVELLPYAVKFQWWGFPSSTSGKELTC